MKKPQKIQVRQSNILSYFQICNECNFECVGSSEKSCEHNFQIHYSSKHKRKKMEVKQ